MTVMLFENSTKITAFRIVQRMREILEHNYDRLSVNLLSFYALHSMLDLDKE